MDYDGSAFEPDQIGTSLEIMWLLSDRDGVSTYYYQDVEIVTADVAPFFSESLSDTVTFYPGLASTYTYPVVNPGTKLPATITWVTANGHPAVITQTASTRALSYDGAESLLEQIG